MDGTPIATSYGGTEIKSPSLTVRGVDASVTGSLIQQQYSVETILINNPAPVAGHGSYQDTANPGINYAVGMFTGGAGTQADILTFTFDARDTTQTGLPFVIVEMDAATIPLMVKATGLVSRPVSGSANTMLIDAYDGFDGQFIANGVLLDKTPAAWTPIDSASALLSPSSSIAIGAPNTAYPLVWKKLRFKIELSGLNPLNTNHTVTLALDPVDLAAGEYIVFDNLKISATDDSDGDGVPDSQELIDGTDPNNPTSYKDTDGDLVPDFVEIEQGTNPNDPIDYLDTDGDLVPDYVETIRQPNNGQPATDATAPNGRLDYIDTDGGGEPDYVETVLRPNLGLTPDNPLLASDDNQDTDGDGVPDVQELVDGTDPNNPLDYKDTDGDLVPDYIEILDGTDPTDPADYKDTDGDLVPDYVETTYQVNDGKAATDPNDSTSKIDTDNGGVADYVETVRLPNLGLPATDPNTAADDDSDGDGVPDAQEIIDGTDPLDPTDYKDTDGDLVPDYIEIIDGTNPNNPADYKDTDNDGVPDHVETIRQPIDGQAPTDPNNPNSNLDTDNGGAPDYVETILLPNLGLPAGNINDPADDDSDGDGVPDAQEIADGTDPNNPLDYKDTDGDGVPDYIESIDGTDPNNPLDYKDTDGDGVPNYVETTRQPHNGQSPTDPNNGLVFLDTDGDLVPDYIEVREGTDPNNPRSYKDSDGDLVPDYVETTYQVNDGKPATNPNDRTSMIDTDNGGLPDYVETVLMPNIGLAAADPNNRADDAANRIAVMNALYPAESIPVHQFLWLSMLFIVGLAIRKRYR